MDRPPDILWIVTTQWRAQACGYAGDPNARTPHLDALAARSVNYAQAVTPHPFGPFARAALLTGVPSPANGVRDYFDPLPVGARTIAHDLAVRGYRTGFFGKWHLAPRARDVALVGEAHAKTIVPPEARGGFGFWEGFEGGFLLNDPWLHGTRLPAPTPFSGYQSDVVAMRAAEWMRSAGEGREEKGAGREPWFCVVSLEAPHPPYAAPAGDFAAGDPAKIMLPANVPCGGESEARARRELAGYYAHIAATDAAIGRLVAHVDANAAAAGRAAPAVVFTSVHGDMHGAHGLFRKGWPHEEAVRVPCLVRLPHGAGNGRGEAGGRGRREDGAVSLVDLAPMTLAWADGAGPSAAARVGATGAGASFISMPSVVALSDQCDRIWRGLRTPTRKLVLNADDTVWLYFDLEADPLEQRNRAHDPACAAEIAALRAVTKSGGRL